MNEFTIQKNKAEQIRIKIREYQGFTFLDIRIHFHHETKTKDEYLPTKKGVTIPILKLAEFQNAITQIAESASQHFNITESENTDDNDVNTQ